MNNRRKLLIAFGASALAAPLASLAQQKGKVWRIGFLYPSSRHALQDGGADQRFQQGMLELGYVQGKNFVIEWRFADGNFERLAGLAAELVELKVDVLVTLSSPATSAAQKATAAIPIVFVNVGNPVGSGFVKSLAHPGGNITGVSNIAGELAAKLLEMLLSIAPKVSRLAVLGNPANPGTARYLKIIQSAAPRTSVKTILAPEARNPQEIEDAFSRMAREKAEAVIVGADSLFFQHRRQIAELAVKHRLPSIYSDGIYAEAGGLMGYGQNRSEFSRRVTTYVDKILKGAKPGDLPVEQPMRFELVINAKTAKALGLTIPQSLLIMADKVIE